MDADLSKKIEDVINATVKQKPDEPVSFMVRVEACATSIEHAGF